MLQILSEAMVGSPRVVFETEVPGPRPHPWVNVPSRYDYFFEVVVTGYLRNLLCMKWGLHFLMEIEISLKVGCSTWKIFGSQFSLWLVGTAIAEFLLR